MRKGKIHIQERGLAIDQKGTEGNVFDLLLTM